MRRAAFSICCLLIACGDDDVPDDGGGADMTAGGDAATPDAAAPDSGAATDLGVTERDAATGTDLGPPGSGCGMAASSTTASLMHDGRTRSYRVHVPSGYDPATPTPVVINFHGRGSNGMEQVFVSEMNPVADREGFIAVYPDGVGETWNAGVCCGEAMSANVDDVGFTAALIDRLAATHCVDAARVYATGFSNGGFMSHRLACQLADRIAAIAPVAGPNGTSPCSPSRPVPVLHFHGTSDAIVPYTGFGGTLAVRDTMSDWASRNGCDAASAPYFTSGDVECEEWSGCDAGTSVRLCTIDGGGHQWPGGFTVPGLGNNTNAISATDAMWDFFELHSL